MKLFQSKVTSRFRSVAPVNDVLASVDGLVGIEVAGVATGIAFVVTVVARAVVNSVVEIVASIIAVVDVVELAVVVALIVSVSMAVFKVWLVRDVEYKSWPGLR